MDNSNSINSNVNFESQSWGKGESANSKIDDYINSALDLTQQNIINSDNQEFTLTRQGLRGREWNEETQTYNPEQLWMTKNVLAFSDNGFTGRPRMAIGKTILPDGSYGYGIIAEHIVGQLMLTKKLVVENENKSFMVDGDSVTIKNANIIMNNDGTNNKDKTLEELLKEASSSGNKIYRQPNQPINANENDLWFDTDDNNTPYVFKDGKWQSVKDTSIDGVEDKISENISNAIDKVYKDMEDMKQAIQDGEMVIFYQNTMPTIPPAKEGDLWYDTTIVNGKKKNEAWIVDNGKWQNIKDSDVISALEQAQNAQTTADGKIKTYWQTNEPQGLTVKDVGDLWFDTDDDNKLYRWNGERWVDVRDKSIDKVAGSISNAIDKVYKDMEDMKQAIQDGEMVIYYQNTMPTIPPAKEGDLWYDTSIENGKKKNEAWIVDNGKWQNIKDSDVIDALEQAQNAQTTADGKIKTYWQTNEPQGLTIKDIGDLWFDIDDKNKLYRWDGKQWIDVQDKSIDDVAGSISSAIGQVYDDMEAMKQAIQDGELVIFYQDTKPNIPPAKEGDLWYDTTIVNGAKKNEAWIVNKGQWQKLKDRDVADALDKANNAQITADGKIKTYWQPNQPNGLTDKDVGDLWFDTDNNNKMWRWDGERWVDVQDKTINEVSKDFSDSIEDLNNKIGNIGDAIQDGVIETYYQSTDPMLDNDKNPKIGDLWFDTLNGKLYRHNGGRKINTRNEYLMYRTQLKRNLNTNDDETEVIADKIIIDTEKFSDTTVPVGGKYRLANQANIYFSDGTNKIMNISWDDRHVDTNIEKTYGIYGYIELEAGIINPNNIKVDRKIIVGSGGNNIPEYPPEIKPPQPPSNAYDIKSIERPPDEQIKVGERYNLPGKLLVTLNNDSSRYMYIVWEDSHVNVNAPNTYTIYGDVLLQGNVTNTNNIRAEIRLIIKDDSPQPQTVNITNVQRFPNITINVGERYELSNTCMVQLSNNTIDYLEVTWEDHIVDTNVPNSYTFYGNIKLKEGITNTENLRPKQTIVVKGSTPQPDGKNNITSVQTFSDISVAMGRYYDLPKTCRVELSNGTSDELGITWHDGLVDIYTPKTYEVYGDLKLKENITNTNNLRPKVNIIVSSNVTEPQEKLNITSVERIRDIKATKNGTFTLPKQVEVNLSNGTSRNLNVRWNDSHVDTSIVKIYEVYGEILLESDIENINKFQAYVRVVVVDDGSQVDKIISVEELPDEQIKVGERYTLPSKILVTTSNSGSKYMFVGWDDSHVNVNVEKTYVVYGEIRLEGGVTNPDNIRAKKTIIVGNKQENKLDILEIEKFRDITINKGDNYELSENALVKFSDNTTIKRLRVIWNTTNVNVNIPNTYMIYGDIQLEEGMTNTKNLKAQQKLIVKETQIEPPEVKPNITSVEKLSDVTIDVGGRYSLPSRVLVQLSDGYSRYLNVTWDERNVNVNVPNTYVAYGDIQLENGITNTKGLRAERKIIVRGSVQPPPENKLNIVSVEKLQDININIGGSYSLPSRVLVKLSNGYDRYLNVTWNTDNVNVNVANTYIVYGDIRLEEGISNTNGIRAERKIIVTGFSPQPPEEQILNITSVNSLRDIRISKKGELVLPTQVKVNLSNNTSTYLNVEWNDSHVDTSQVKTYDVYGEIILQKNITNTSGFKAYVKVIITEEEVQIYDITSVEKIDDVITIKGQYYTLPQDVVVYLTNGKSRKIRVKWNDSHVNNNAPNTYYVEGDLLLDGTVTNTKGLKANVKVIIKESGFSFWDPITDKGIVDAIDKAQNAQSTADGKISTYYQNTFPNKNTHPNLSEGDIFIHTGEGMKQYRYTNGEWRSIQDKSISDLSKDLSDAIYDINSSMGDLKDAISDGVIHTYYQSSAPSGKVGDLWFNTSTGKLYRHNGNAWDLIEDKGLTQAIRDAQNAKDTADGKISTYYQSTFPNKNTHPNLSEGDLLIHTGEGMKQYRYTNGEWRSIQDKSISDLSKDLSNAIYDINNSMGDLKDAISDGVIHTYYQSSTPSGKLGDLWFNTSTGKLYRHNGSSWDLIEDKGLTQAIRDAQNAKDTADGKISTYYQPEQPNKSSHPNLSEGDLWVDTDGGNRQYRYTNGKWVDISDILLGSSNNMIINSLPNKNDTKFWGGFDGATVGNTFSNGNSQLYIQRVAGKNPYMNSKYYKCEPNTTYTLSFEYSSDISATYYILGTNKEKSVNEIGSYNDYMIHNGVSSIPISASFTKKSFTFTTHQDEIYFYVRFTIESSNSSTSDKRFNVRKIKLEKGHSATEWSKSPSEEAFYQVSNITKPDGSLDANQMRGEILAGKTNILCSNSATGRVLALNENGIIVGTANSSGVISQEGTFITKDGINANYIKSGTINAININGSTITGSSITAGSSSGFHTLLNNKDPFGVYYGSANTATVKMFARNSSNTSWSYFTMYDEKGRDVFDISGARIAGDHETLLRYKNATTLTISAHHVYTAKELVSGGKKQAIVNTEHYGYRELYCEESTRVYFTESDISETQEKQDNNGETYYTKVIAINPVFLETVELNSIHRYIISVTPYSNARVWVHNVLDKYVTIRSDKQTEFSYEIKAIRKGHKDLYIQERENVFREKSLAD